MKQLKLVFFGGGGVAIDTANYILDINKHLGEQDSIVISDLVDEGQGRVVDLNNMLGYQIRVHRDVSTVEDFQSKYVVITLGHSPVRHEKFRILKNLGASFYNVIHPQSVIADTAEIGESCILAPFSVVSPYAVVADNVIINVRSTVGHDVVIGESSIVSPHVFIGGSCVCGTSVFIGAGTVIIPELEIGNFAKLSAGSIVTATVPAGHFANGNPAVAKKLFNSEHGHSVLENPSETKKRSASEQNKS